MMTTNIRSLSNEALAVEARQAAGAERQSTAYLVQLLIEVEQRDLHLALGYSSMFVYCTRALLLSEQSAYRRITAARAVRRYPAILPLLADGALSLSSVGLLAPHLTDENLDAMLDGASYKSTREVERLVAVLHPQPDIAATVRAIPKTCPPATSDGLFAVPAEPASQRDDRSDERSRPNEPMHPSSHGAGAPPASARARSGRPVVAPLSPTTYLLRVTITDETNSKLRRLQALLRHSIPDGNPASVIDRAFTVLLEQTERRVLASASRPRPAATARTSGRKVPAAVRRSVWQRDAGRCAFVGASGRCCETGFLEFHHVVPFATGGATTASNIELRCRAHNQYEARLYFGATDASGDLAARRG